MEYYISKLLLLAILVTKSSQTLFEWKGAAETGREYAVGDPPPRPPRLPPNSTCTFGPLLQNVSCSAAHNYFHEFNPIVEARGQVVSWKNDACSTNDDEKLFSLMLINGETEINVVNDISKPNEENQLPIIVFVDRGKCSFADKIHSILSSIKHRQFKVVAIVLVDLPSSEELLPPGLGEAHNIHVPVVMIAHQSALEIFTQIKNNDDDVIIDDVSDVMEGNVILVSASIDSLRGKLSCQCAVESPEVMHEFHFMHREGVKERLDFLVDEGKRALMSFSPVRTLNTMKHYAQQIPVHSTIGVSQALLDDFVKDVLPLFPGPIILVTTDYNSDRSAPKPFDLDHSWLLDAPHLVSHWFSDNWATTVPKKKHDRLTLLPIGINDRHVINSHGDRRLLLNAVNTVSENSRRPAIAMANFHHSEKLGWWTNPASGVCCDRLDAWHNLNGSMSSSNTNFISIDNHDHEDDEDKKSSLDKECLVETSTSEESPIKFLNFSDPYSTWLQHSNFAFEICPHGNGIDTHRTWEALMLKTIPIVKTSSLDPLYEDLPVVIVSSWSELIGTKGYENMKTWQFKLAPLFEESPFKEKLHDYLTVEYWVKLIKQKQSEVMSFDS